MFSLKIIFIYKEILSYFIKREVKIFLNDEKA